MRNTNLEIKHIVLLFVELMTQLIIFDYETIITIIAFVLITVWM